MVVRSGSLTRSMSHYLVSQIEAHERITVCPCSTVSKAHGDANLEEITLVDTTTGDTLTLPAFALFIFIGARPHTEWVGGAVERDPRGFILTGRSLVRGGRRPEG